MPSIDERIDRIFKENLKKKPAGAEQRAAIKSVAQGRDTLVVMPTGGGKTSVYQAAALLRDGKTLLLSPLDVTVQEQLQSIKDKNLPPAEEAHDDGRVGERTEFVLVSPGELGRADVVENIRKARPSLVVVDEAHCISEKGHEFKQHYVRLKSLISQLDRPTVVALTATAPPPVQREIQARLGMRDTYIVKQTLERKNLWLGVSHFENDAARREELVKRVAAETMPGFVYVADHQRAESVRGELVRAGVKADALHSKLTKALQNKRRRDFEAGKFDVLVATTHFSMGISNDKVNFVYHCDPSDSVESYYQESGRAGRDGQDARALIFYIPSDLEQQPEFTSGPELTESEVEAVVAALEKFQVPVDPKRLAKRAGTMQDKVEAVTRRLWDMGMVEISARGEVSLGKGAEISPIRVMAAQIRRRMYDRSRTEMMRGYIETGDCRRVYILNYFGETGYPPCGNCDNCKAGKSIRRDNDHDPLAPGTLVVNATWGPGLALRRDGDTITALFDEVGYQRLDRADLQSAQPHSTQE